MASELDISKRVSAEIAVEKPHLASRGPWANRLTSSRADGYLAGLVALILVI